MADLPTFSDLFRRARDEILARNPSISKDAVEREGSDANVLVAAACAAADEVIGQLTVAAAGLYLDSAKDAALDRLVFDRYGLVRKPASPSIGTVSFTTTVAAGSSFTIPSGTKLSTADGTQFLTTEAGLFSAGSTGPVDVTVRSILAGSTQQAKAGTITNIISAITGQPSDFLASNLLATAGASDAEKDDSLRDRARRFFTTARRGTLEALVSGALAVPGVVSAKAFETLDELGRPARLVQLVIADQFLESLVDYFTVPPSYAAQAQTLSTTVFNSLEDVRAAGIFVSVIVAQVVLLPVQLALAFTAGTDTEAAAGKAVAAIVNYVNSLAPGASFVKATALDALQTVPGLVFSGAELVSPVGDVVPMPLQVIRTDQRFVKVL